MNYRVIRHADNEGEERENHKYVARVLIKKATNKKQGNHYRYFYDKEEYAAYLKGKEEKEKDSKKGGLSEVVNKLFSGKAKADDNKNGEKFLDKLFGTKSERNALANEAKIKLNENVDKGKKLAEKYISENGGNAVDTIQTSSSVGNKVKDFIKTALTSGIGMAVANLVYNAIENVQENIKNKKRETLEETEEEIHDEEFPDLNLKTEEFTKDEDQALINPEYDPYNYGTSMNCTYCTAAYDLRQRGYDVEAMEILETDDPTTIYEVASWYEGVEFEYGDNILYDKDELEYMTVDEYYDALDEEEIEKVISHIEETQEDGSYGHMFLWWTGGGGHDVVWEMENGEVKFRDCQTNEVVEPEDYLELSCSFDYFRSDNLELADEIERVVKNRD